MKCKCSLPIKVILIKAIVLVGLLIFANLVNKLIKHPLIAAIK